jgi:hypothetical protein
MILPDTNPPLQHHARWAPAIYFVLGQVGWFAGVLSAARGMSYLGIAVIVALVGLHLARVARPVSEVKLLITVLLIGGVWETALISLGLLAYPHSTLFYGMAPPWIMTMWVLFAAQFNTTYRWLKHRMIAGAVLGAVAGPISFHAGAALGALRFVEPLPAAVALAAGWAAILPLITLMSRRWDGVQA